MKQCSQEHRIEMREHVIRRTDIGDLSKKEREELLWLNH
jgi:hypothetical protein